MEKLGTVRKSKKQQAVSAELEMVIEDFASAMRFANKVYVSRPPQCPHDSTIHFTPSMYLAWAKYVAFSAEHPND
jgi:hypothetical protein